MDMSLNYTQDITITHSDSKYFNKHYETQFSSSLCADPISKAQEDQIAFSKGETSDDDDGYKPMYYTKSYAQDPKKIEMSFDCQNYQHQFRKEFDSGNPPERKVYQSIFLDNRNREDLWTIDEIDASTIIEKKWWHQLGKPSYCFPGGE